MKILFVNSLYHPYHIGGAEKSVQILAESLVKLGCEVVVVCLGKVNNIAYLNGVKVYYEKLANVYWPFSHRQHVFKRVAWNLIDCHNVIMARKVSCIIEEEKPDVVHTNNLQGFSTAVWGSAKRLGVGVVHTLRDHFLLCPRSNMFNNGKNCLSQCLSCKLFAIPKRVSSRNVDCVVGISKYILDRHANLGWFSNCPGTVIHNAFGDKPKYIYLRSENVLRFGFIGRLGEYKGIRHLCETFLLFPKDADVKLIIAGTGDVEFISDLKALVKGHPVKFLGFVDPDEFYQTVDVVIVPSIVNEAFGRTVIEAYAHGIPVIASQRGGLPEIVINRITGLLYNADSHRELFSCMKEFCAENSFSPPNKECVEFVDKFSTSYIARQYISLYKSVYKKL